MAQEWNSHVNTKLYGQDGGYNDNREKVEFKSGRTIFYKKNSAPKKTHALNLSLNDSAIVDGKTEFQWFIYWYEYTIESGTLSFNLTDIVAHSGTKEYLLTETPKWSGQRTKEINLTLEEV